MEKTKLTKLIAGILIVVLILMIILYAVGALSHDVIVILGIGIICAIFLICGFLIPDGSKAGEWFLIVMGLSFVLLFSSKFIMNYVK